VSGRRSGFVVSSLNHAISEVTIKIQPTDDSAAPAESTLLRSA
jgi:hypothetical protein